MNNYQRNNAINNTYENELNKQACNGTNQFQQQQVNPNQLPAPTRRLPQGDERHSLTIIKHDSKLRNEVAMDSLEEAKLVKIRHHEEEREEGRSKNQVQDQVVTIGRDQGQKRTSFQHARVEFAQAGEGVGSPTNVDYEDEDGELTDEYDDDYEQTDELTDLSRQSMVPLHELIAYYQYIQQGSDQTDPSGKGTISRQSSSASQQTTKTRYSQTTDDTVDSTGAYKTSAFIYNKSESNHKDLADRNRSSEEVRISRTLVPEIQVGNPNEEPIDESRDSQKQEQEVPVAPKVDRRRIRANVVLELINSERDFVKHLHDVVEGYLVPARRHPEIFTGERINTIFSNIEQVYEFQRKFLASLERCINWDDLTQSEVGQCFLEYEKGFSSYHYYCNNHPNATSELQDLYTKPRFVKFFEACRLLQNMIDISLDGFLLTPIQKICKYPLQLNELLKNTDESHPDHSYVVDALESMRNCANLANERKRRIEALADVMSFQEKVENWFGPKLSDTSSILMHSGEVSKMASHTWSQGLQLYLFDHLLLISKKDLLKRNNLILKGRICMDTITEISDADEYKPKKSFKLYCGEQKKWFVFTTRSEKEKDEWIRAFERERNLVESDESEGFRITEREIGIARRALQNRKHSRSARYRHKRPDTAIVDQIDLDDANMIMNRTLSLPSCIHPSHVMNFVEDSKVVSTSSSSSRKKNSSPRSSSRSPMPSSQLLAQDLEASQQTSGSWFKKMGSKKLAKGQIYNVNGQTGQQASSKASHLASGSSPTSVLTSATTIVSSDTAAMKYDQLEKRHRDHMVSEEQARLFRLNNDLPPIFQKLEPTSPTNTYFSPSKLSPSSALGGASSSYRPKSLNQPAPNLLPPERPLRRGSDLPPTRASFEPQDLNLRSLSIGLKSSLDERLAGAGEGKLKEQQPSSANREAPLLVGGSSDAELSVASFEATVMLSSGRVVKVREDSV